MDPAKKIRIESSISRNPSHSAYQISKNLNGISRQEVESVMGVESPKGKAASCGGVRLSHQRVFTHRPVGSPVKAHLRKLVKGRAYPVDQLSQSTGVSVETIKRHAKDLLQGHPMGCLRWVDMGEDEWTLCALHPETAQQYEEQP